MQNELSWRGFWSCCCRLKWLSACSILFVKSLESNILRISPSSKRSMFRSSETCISSSLSSSSMIWLFALKLSIGILISKWRTMFSKQHNCSLSSLSLTKQNQKFEYLMYLESLCVSKFQGYLKVDCIFLETRTVDTFHFSYSQQSTISVLSW